MGFGELRAFVYEGATDVPRRAPDVMSAHLDSRSSDNGKAKTIKLNLVSDMYKALKPVQYIWT
jgi:hypothetical protein